MRYKDEIKIRILWRNAVTRNNQRLPVLKKQENIALPQKYFDPNRRPTITKESDIKHAYKTCVR